jgi:hypothetical protein
MVFDKKNLKKKKEKREKESWRGMQRQDHGTVVFFLNQSLTTCELLTL